MSKGRIDPTPAVGKNASAPMKMSGRKLLLLIACGLAAVLLVVFHLYLPRLVHDAIVSQAGKFGLKNPQLRVVAVGWRQARLADVTVGDAAAPALRVGEAVVEYSLAGLWRKEIRGIRLAGVMVRIENRGRGFRFPGLEGATRGSGAMASIGRLELEGGTLRLLLGERELDIPFSADLRAVGPGYSLEAAITPFGETVGLQGTVDSEFTSAAIAFTVPGMDLATLIKQSGYGASLSGRGRIAASGKFLLRDGKFLAAEAKIASLGDMRLEIPAQGVCELSSLRLAFAIGADFSVRDIVANARGRRLRLGELAVESPFGLDVRGAMRSELEFVVSGLDVARPFPVICERISGKVTLPLETARFNGDFLLRTKAAPIAGPWVSGRPYALNGDFQGRRQEGGEITWTLKAGGNGGIAMSAGKDSVRGTLKLDASLAGDARQGRATVSGRLAGADLQLAGIRAKAGEVGGRADLLYDFGGDWSARGSLQARDGQLLSAGDSGVQAEGIGLSLPWRYPGAGSGKRGSFSIGRLQGGGVSARDVSGILSQQGQGLAFSGLAHSGLPEIAVSFKGSYAPLIQGRLQADFLVAPAVLPAKTRLQALHPLLQGMEGSGRFAAKGTLWAADGKAGGGASLEIVDGDLDHAGEGIVLRGLQTGIRLDSLFDLITAPAQRLIFKELRWQGNTLRDGEVAFRGEGGGTLFIESGRFIWNRGVITLDPLRLGPGAAAIQLTFRCRDVDLADMLNALAGSKIVSSDARLSGVIPVKVVNGSPVFLDGYLDTASGISGRLQISKPEAISGGQLLVEEAIRDFNYNWIKVRLSSSNDRLNLVVSIDGAPAGKLPLRYDQKKKDFVRDSPGKRHVELKGLQLDIRFNDIDLRDLLEAGGQVTARKK